MKEEKRICMGECVCVCACKCDCVCVCVEKKRKRGSMCMKEGKRMCIRVCVCVCAREKVFGFCVSMTFFSVSNVCDLLSFLFISGLVIIKKELCT